MTEPVKPGDLLEEIVRPRRAYVKLAPQITSGRSAGGDQKGTFTNWEFALGSELPFYSSAQLLFAFGSWEEVDQIQLGLGYGREFKIIPGKLYFTCRVEAGLSGAVQQKANALGLFLGGAGGLKYYLNYGDGIRLELDLTGRYGPFFTEWFDENDREVTDQMPYGDLNFSGVGVRLGLVFPL